MPLPVLEKAAKELVSYGDSGMSVMEMSHRGKAYMEIQSAAESLLRGLMNIPQNYKVLFMQGGATQQFSAVPLNLCVNGKADYIVTGSFAKKAAQEAQRYIKVNVAASSEDGNFTYIPDEFNLSANADYVHYTANNTIYGTRFASVPKTGGVPLVTDMSSSILSEVFDISKFALIYAGAQKNIAPAGVTIVILREELIGHALPVTPHMLNYKTHADEDSLHNTPPCYSIYMMKLVLEWLKEQGGVPALQKMNEEKAKLLYDQIDESKIFSNPVAPRDRSLMNVIFVTGNENLDKKFVKEAAAAGLSTLAGHRSVGGMRASIYNAMPLEGVKALVGFMKKFETENK
ncbi:MAG: 3-phosphoserine/phosphohydroxythreonine transaminase [Defluviitaleaceae bacterium]|nr:3-phosphoserine/phosphohydroxythreonine transaminase [Defluviitaleaceae bacterium]